MGLSKAYDCFSHDLLIAKFEAYGLDNLFLIYLMITYVFGNKGQKLSLHVVTGLMLLRVFFPRDILGLLLLNIFANGIFLFIEKSDICN